MSSDTSSASAAPGPADLPQTMRLQGVVNVIMRGLLHTPGIARGVGSKVVNLYVIGRKSGKQYSFPVAYTNHDGALVIGTPFRWGRNLRTGEPLEVLYKGHRRIADVEAFKDETNVVALYDVMCRDNHNFAKFNKVGLDAQGNPNPEDLRTAWANGARAFKLTLRDR